MKNTLPSKNRQRGVSLFAFTLILVLVGSLLFFAYKIVPVYINYLTIVKIVEDIQEEEGVQEKHPREIRMILGKRFKANNLWNFEVQDTVKVIRDPKHGIMLSVNYETRVPLIYNLDIVARFDKMVDSNH